MANLLRMCCECKKIMIDGKWVGMEYENYQKEIDKAEHITDGYCPEHMNDNSYRKELNERRKIKSLHLVK
jgi:hypothetical protein